MPEGQKSLDHYSIKFFKHAVLTIASQMPSNIKQTGQLGLNHCQMPKGGSKLDNFSILFLPNESSILVLADEAVLNNAGVWIRIRIFGVTGTGSGSMSDNSASNSRIK